MNDIFDLFGGGAGRSRQQRGPQRGESVQHRLKVSLEDMYKGTTRYRPEAKLHMKNFQY